MIENDIDKSQWVLRLPVYDLPGYTILPLQFSAQEQKQQKAEHPFIYAHSDLIWVFVIDWSVVNISSFLSQRIEHIVIRIDNPVGDSDSTCHGHDLTTMKSTMVDYMQDIVIAVQIILSPGHIEMQDFK